MMPIINVVPLILEIRPVYLWSITVKVVYTTSRFHKLLVMLFYVKIHLGRTF